MLSVAQAVHHPETPGSASKHSTIGHSWSSDKPAMLKRRRTESDYCAINKKILTQNVMEHVKRQFNFNDQEITLTPIPKNNNYTEFNELLYGNMKTTLTIENEKSVEDEAISEKKESERIATNIPPKVISFLENSGEIQVTKVGSNENIKLINQDEISEGNNNNNQEFFPVTSPESEEENTFLDAKTIDLTEEVTIKPCSRPQNLKVRKSPSPNKKTNKFQARIDQAKFLLKKDPISIDIEPTFEENNYIRSNSPIFDVQSDIPTIPSVVECEPFDVGISCDQFYNTNKDKPYYATGFPNPPGENRCWTNATLQALFALPVLNKLDLLDIPNCSTLMKSLINVQTSWREGTTGDFSFDKSFNNFKNDLSAIEGFYNSRAQQDVSEFIMNLLNFLKTEFDNILKKESESNEIENIPNNEQDTSRKSISNTTDFNKRLPLADISAAATQFKNHIITSGNQQDIGNKQNSLFLTCMSKDKNETKLNPIDEYFLLYMMENFTCNGCMKQRQQKVENLMLFIDLPSEEHGETVKLIDIINTTYALEQRDMTCETCKHGVHSMSTKFRKNPKILTVQVKRYRMTNEGTITKICTLVQIPQVLKLSSLVINNEENCADYPEYEPVCIISHIGDNIDSGHYVSFVKHQGQWFYYDDMNVKVVSVDEVFKCVQNTAYVIFFQGTELGKEMETTLNEKNKKESIIS